MTAGGKREGAGRNRRKVPWAAITVRVEAEVADRLKSTASKLGISQNELIAESILLMLRHLGK